MLRCRENRSSYIATKRINGKLSKSLQEEVEKSRRHEEWRDDYMTLLEHYQERYDEGFKDGQKNIELERQNTEAERKRADAAESRANEAESKIRELEAKLASMAGR